MTVGRANLVNKTELQALCGRPDIGARRVCGVCVCNTGHHGGGHRTLVNPWQDLLWALSIRSFLVF